ncbi:hypothetical protein DOZ91_22055 [Peribacillus frigoritolerans]|nr:hypothetical protein DOZ91_22055 [Peribacillus frigoritolerans]
MNPHKNCRQKGFYQNFNTELIGTEGARLLREKRVEGRPRRCKSDEGGPPAESEYLEWKSTFHVLLNKN